MTPFMVNAEVAYRSWYMCLTWRHGFGPRGIRPQVLKTCLEPCPSCGAVYKAKWGLLFDIGIIGNGLTSHRYFKAEAPSATIFEKIDVDEEQTCATVAQMKHAVLEHVQSLPSYSKSDAKRYVMCDNTDGFCYIHNRELWRHLVVVLMSMFMFDAAIPVIVLVTVLACAYVSEVDMSKKKRQIEVWR